jgi:hypothetical protein
VFRKPNARVFASSHTCLPILRDFATAGGRSVLINNGAAGTPNFKNTRYGIFTRIARTQAQDALYGTTLDGVHIDAIPIHYDHARFEREFLAHWPVGSPAHAFAADIVR